METEFQNAHGKGIGEVIRDITDFLSTPYVINPQKKIDLCRLVENLNMHEQFSFALLSEAQVQGWSPEEAEGFYRSAARGVVSERVINGMIAAFRNRQSSAYKEYEARYGNRFSALDGSYWATALALGIDADRVSDVLRYLRTFTVTLMEFAYMEDKNPDATYTWCYYDSFCRMLEELTAEPDPDPLPLRVRALGGSAGKREGDAYPLSLGLDIENPNTDRMARGVQLDITLKDKTGHVITVIADQLQSIDPDTIYHYGITRRIRGATVASFSATVKATSYLKLTTPIMQHVAFSSPRLVSTDAGASLEATVCSEYDCPLRTLTLHYQFLNEAGHILGGGSEWLMNGITPDTPQLIQSQVGVSIKGASKVVCSVDFDAMDLIDHP